jgi:hypothetical protein
MSILCVYVLAAPPQFATAAERFCESYRQHPAGAEHDLLVVRKGDHPWPGPQTMTMRWPDEGFDIGPFQSACHRYTDYDLVMLLSSTGRILGDDWLAHYCAAFEKPGVAAVSATGSYAIGHSGMAFNPHLRTANIMVHRDLFNSLDLPLAVTKMDCWQIEHADRNLTRSLHASGYRCLVVGRDGTTYDGEDWSRSDTFWQGGQRNLLISDHQTDRYTDGTAAVRRELEMEAWQNEPALAR